MLWSCLDMAHANYEMATSISTTTIVAALTTRQKRSYPFHVDYSAAESDLERDGTVLLEQLLTIDKTRLRRRRGRLPADRMSEVNEALLRSLALR